MPEDRLFFPPVKILLVGSLGSGKTTVAGNLSERTGFPYKSIDRCREMHGDSTVAGEYRAQTAFMEACSTSRQTILEFSGCGPHVDMAAVALRESGLPAFVIWLDAPERISRERARGRKNQVPFPLPWGEVALSVFLIYHNLEETWERVWTSGRTFHTLRLSIGEEDTAGEIADSIIKFVWG